MFGFLASFFYVILYQPLFNSLILLYNYIPGHDFGVAIIFLTLIIRFILFPISLKATNSQKGLQDLQPKILEIQKKYKDDKEKQARETLELYKREKINPFSGLLLAFIQLPILIALYQVFWNGLKPAELTGLYSFVSNPGVINAISLHIIDLSKANFVLAVLAGVTQYVQTKMMLPKNIKKSGGQSKEADLSNMMQMQMTYFMPVFTVIILISLPSALGLYWTVSGLFSVIQQYFFLKKNKKSEVTK